jgi:glycerol-1-phosphate dehydrogenase [NAD(P)+]
MLSGLAMQAAGSSGPASGGEHLISHYLDMTAERDGEPHDFHGCQVAVGTVVTAALYARLRTLDPASIDVGSAVDRLLPWEEYAKILDRRFGTLAESVRDHAQGAYPTRAELADRLRRLVDEWDQIMPWVFETLRSPEDLAAELDSAECPTRFDQIGVSHARALRCVRHCKDIRNRYTILHLLWELGLLDDLGREVVDGQYRRSDRR